MHTAPSEFQQTLNDVKWYMRKTEWKKEDIPFIPFNNKDFYPEMAQRQIQLCWLLHDIYDEMVRKGLAKSYKERPLFVAGLGHYGKYFWFHTVGAYLCYDAHYWRAVEQTPLWLAIHGIKKWENDETIRNTLSHLEHSHPPKFICHENNYLIPLYILVNAEKEIVIKNIVEQIEKVASLIKDL